MSERFKKAHTVGELIEMLEQLPKDTPLVDARGVHPIQAHYLDGRFYGYHYGEGYNCCNVAGYTNNPKHEYILRDAVRVV